MAMAAAMMMGCAAVADAAAPDPGDELVLEVHGVDVAAVERALERWRAESGGRVNVVVGEHGDASIATGAEPHYSRAGRYMTVPVDDVEWWAVHLVGRMLGMPLHDGEGILAREPTRAFNEADRASCRAAGFCE